MRSLVLIISVLAYSMSVLAQENVSVTIEHDGENRNFFLYIPSSYSEAGQPTSMVFNFHGFGSNAIQQRGYSDMNRVAEQEGFIVCYPNGIDSAWNVDWAFGSTADDLGFTSAMIDTISASYNINPGRIYSCGMSNGGFFSYQLACNLSDRIAAVASVTGSFSPNMIQNCQPSRTVPTMEIHGTEDDIVPYDGLAGTAEPIEDVIAFWVNHNNCSSTFEASDIPDLNPNDGSTVSLNYYKECDDDTEVLFAIVDGGAHTWPSSPLNFAGTNLDYDASQEIWNFFKKHKIAAIASNDDLLTPEFELYPNPTTSILNIDTAVENCKIYNLQGQLVLATTDKKVDLSNYATGMYFVRLEANGKSVLKKVILE